MKAHDIIGTASTFGIKPDDMRSVMLQLFNPPMCCVHNLSTSNRLPVMTSGSLWFLLTGASLHLGAK